MKQAISESVLNVAGTQLRVYTLDDGSRVINQEDMLAFFDMDIEDVERIKKELLGDK